MHINGVNDNILNDFKIRVDMYTSNIDNSVFEAISRTILETGNSRVLTFHSRSEISTGNKSNVIEFFNKKNEFIKCFHQICKKEFPHLKDKYKKIRFEGFTAKTKNRINVLNEFDQTPDNEIFILASCKTIGEGVDTKKANMVVFVDPKQSYIEIVQNIGRICRKQKNISTILIPTYVDVNKYTDSENDDDRDKIIRQEMSKTGDFNGILNVLSALRQEDPYIFELCLKYPEIYTVKEINNNLKKNGIKISDNEIKAPDLFDTYESYYENDITEEENFNRLSTKIEKNIQIINNKVLEDDIYIDNQYLETEYFVKTENGYKTTTKTDTNQTNDSELDSEQKIKKPNRNIKPIVHTNDEIKVLWKIVSDVQIDKKIFGGYIESTVIPSSDEKWLEKLLMVSNYIDINKKPSTCDKDPNIKKLGSWIQSQQTNYKKNQYII